MDEQEPEKKKDPEDGERLVLVKKAIEENGRDWEKWPWEERAKCFVAYRNSNLDEKEKILDLVRIDVDYGFAWYLAGVD